MDDSTNSILLIIQQHYKQPAKITRSALEYLQYFVMAQFRALFRIVADYENPRLSFLYNAAIQLYNERFKMTTNRLSVMDPEPPLVAARTYGVVQKQRSQCLNSSSKPVFVNLAYCYHPIREQTSQSRLAELIHYYIDFSRPLECISYPIETTGTALTAANALYYAHEEYGDYLARLVMRSPDYGK